jgi:two-component system, NtrC family, response regulator GlrR
MDADRTLSHREAFDAPWMRRAPIIAWSEPAGATREKKLLERVVVGTAPSADVVLNDRAVSRLHAELDPRDDGLWVRDLGSHNGTFVEGIRVVAANIPHGAKLQLGHSSTGLGSSP